MLTTGLSFLAGVLSTLSPCVIPLLPILLGSAFQGHVLGPLALTAGLSLSFGGLGVLLAAFGFAVGLDGDWVRIGAAVLMTGFGLVLLVEPLQRVFAASMTPLVGGANGRLALLDISGLTGQFVIGLLLGVVWVPCTGPTLGAALGLASQGRSLGAATVTMMVFTAGAATPLLMLAYGVRGAAGARRDLARAADRIARRTKPVLGMTLLLVGALSLTGLDRLLEAAFLGVMPAWLLQLTTRF